MSEYDEQAESFLNAHNLRFRAVQHADTCPPWTKCPPCIHGDRYRITISRKDGGRISFDFWNSLRDQQDGVTTVPAYAALSCISNDAYTADTFQGFCEGVGYDEDSREVEQTWKRCNKFAKRLRAFFSESELEELAEIQ